MSIAHDFNVNKGMMGSAAAPVPTTNPPPSLQRIAHTRRRQGLSLRTVARRLGKPIEQVRRLENPERDMLVSELYQWQKALEVPIAELLEEAGGPLSEPVLTRARLLRVMKTVRAIKEEAKNVSIERMTMMLEEQLIEVMPELQDVSAWHSVGQRRSHDEVGRTAERVIPESLFNDTGG